MSEGAKKAMQALESAAGLMSEADLAYVAGYADGVASANARDSDESEAEAEEQQ